LQVISFGTHYQIRNKTHEKPKRNPIIDIIRLSLRFKYQIALFEYELTYFKTLLTRFESIELIPSFRYPGKNLVNTGNCCTG